MIEEKAWMKLLSHAVQVSPQIAGEVLSSSKRIAQLLGQEEEENINTPLYRRPKKEEHGRKES